MLCCSSCSSKHVESKGRCMWLSISMGMPWNVVFSVVTKNWTLEALCNAMHDLHSLSLGSGAGRGLGLTSLVSALIDVTQHTTKEIYKSTHFVLLLLLLLLFWVANAVRLLVSSMQLSVIILFYFRYITYAFNTMSWSQLATDSEFCNKYWKDIETDQSWLNSHGLWTLNLNLKFYMQVFTQTFIYILI